MADVTAQHQAFFELTPERILRAVERLGVRCTGRCLALNSMENRVFEVEIDLPMNFEVASPSERFRVVKFYRPGRWSAQQIREEHQFLRDCKAAEVPVVVPEADEAGETLFQEPESGIWYTVFPRVGGRTPDEFTKQQLLQLGRLLGRMHRAGSAQPAPHRLKLTPEVYGRQNLEFLISSKTVPNDYVPQYRASVEALCAIGEKLFAGVPLQRIHGDAHIGNLLWGSNGPAWVDFDDMVEGPVVQDLWLLVSGRDEDSRLLRESLYEGYSAFAPFDRRHLKLVELLRALRMIHFSAWIARRWEDPSFRRVFVHFGTQSYWREQLIDVHEQLQLVERIAAGLEEPF